MPETTKQFDCVRMKRKAQEQIWREVENLTPEERARYFREAAERYRESRSAPGGSGELMALFEKLGRGRKGPV